MDDREQEGDIYILQSRQLPSLYKIGKCRKDRLHARMRELEVNVKNRLIAACLVDNYHFVERVIHSCLRAERIPQSEYFVLTESDIAEVIDYLRDVTTCKGKFVQPDPRFDSYLTPVPPSIKPCAGVPKRPFGLVHKMSLENESVYPGNIYEYEVADPVASWLLSVIAECDAARHKELLDWIHIELKYDYREGISESRIEQEIEAVYCDIRDELEVQANSPEPHPDLLAKRMDELITIKS
jgi:hypothetical protein